jgi:proline dehydrogenase
MPPPRCARLPAAVSPRLVVVYERSPVATEQELEATRRRLFAHPQALNAVLQTARALQRTPDTVSMRDVKDFGGSN